MDFLVPSPSRRLPAGRLLAVGALAALLATFPARGGEDTAPTTPAAAAPAPGAAGQDGGAAPAGFGGELSARLAAAFDADRAFADLVAQVDLGPRHPGTPGAAAFVAWIEDRLLEANLQPRRQEFVITDPLTGQGLPGVNVVATYRREAPRLVILSCHWDSRRWADSDPDPAARRRPVPAANDGGSGVAVLLEMARVLAAHPLPPDLGVEFAFFDFEDQGIERAPETFALGAREYAARFARHADVVAAINIDMIGDRDLRIPVELYSRRHAPRVVADVWSHGRRLHPLNFADAVGQAIFDDHIRLQRVGLPAINLIDFEYREWHTLADTPAACSPESLRAVGRTLLSYLGAGAREWTP